MDHLENPKKQPPQAEQDLDALFDTLTSLHLPQAQEENIPVAQPEPSASEIPDEPVTAAMPQPSSESEPDVRPESPVSDQTMLFDASTLSGLKLTEESADPDPALDPNWLDDLLSSPVLTSELGPDEHAVNSAGLTHPDDMEVTRIIQETLAQTYFEPHNSQPQEPFRDDEYRDTFGNGEVLGQIFESGDTDVTPSSEPYYDAPRPRRPARKARPKRKKGVGLWGLPHLAATVIWMALAVFIGVTLGRVVWLSAADLLALGRENKEVKITITETDDLDSIADKLHQEGLVNYPQLFKMYVSLTGKADVIDVGEYTLNTILDYNALVNGMHDYGPIQKEIEVVIPEGYTCAQIFKLLAEKEVCTVEELEESAANAELSNYWFLEGVERGTKYCLEGYLFPDTYRFYTNDDPVRVLEKFLAAFDDRFTDKMHESLIKINEQYAQMMSNNGYSWEHIQNNPITIREVVIIASMIERESAAESESYTISSVIFNRLSNPSFPKLQIDATVVYALGGKTDPLTYKDLEFDSPYNTYLYPGLPVGAISNPGRDSLNAAMNPEDTDYYYYALNPNTNRHHFSRTEDEHNAFNDSIANEK